LKTELYIDRRIILKWNKIDLKGEDWIHLAQDRDQWWALVKHAIEPLSSIKL
jgi:hypothetical protein